MTTLARSGFAAFAAALSLTLAACSSGSTASSSAASTSSATTPVATAAADATNTGTPGAMMSTAASMMMSSAVQTAASAGDAEHNAADVMFAQMMIPHHQDAIVMADLAPDRAESAPVKDLAARIKAAQAPEIEEMTGWLVAWGIPPMMGTSAAMMSSAAMGGMGNMDHGGSGDSAGSAMPGMMSADEMAELTAASGAEFDKLFLELMIVHHQGAIDMADAEIAQGAYPDAIALSESIKTSQTAEIAEMQQLLQTL